MLCSYYAVLSMVMYNVGALLYSPLLSSPPITGYIKRSYQRAYLLHYVCMYVCMFVSMHIMRTQGGQINSYQHQTLSYILGLFNL